MSNDVVISVENLSKRYRLGQIGATSLRESTEHWWHKLRGRNPDVEMGEVGQGQQTTKVKDYGADLNDHACGVAGLNDSDGSNDSQYVWALKDVSFEVKKGEVLGISSALDIREAFSMELEYELVREIRNLELAW